MENQIFISYRRQGGDVTAKLICEALKNRGFTVFYDFDALKGGYFDLRIIKAIEECSEFILVLPPEALDRCVNENDWVRQEIVHAIKCQKNIIPVMLPGFEFPEQLPADIEDVKRYSGVRFMMEYFDAVIDKIVERLAINPACESYERRTTSGGAEPIEGQIVIKRPLQLLNCARSFSIRIDGEPAGEIACGGEVTVAIKEGKHNVSFHFDNISADTTVTVSPAHPVAIVQVSLANGLWEGKLVTRIMQ